jgi:hypothetical protein
MTPFETYIDRLLRLHELIALHPDDEDGGDPLRDELEELELLLSDEEKNWVKDLSGEIYMIYGEDMYYVVSTEEEKKCLKKLLIEQVKNQDWLNVRTTLRASLNLPRYMIALYRGQAWAQQSQRLSLMFFHHANLLIDIEQQIQGVTK